MSHREDLIMTMVLRLRERYPWLGAEEPAVLTPLLLVSLIAEMIEIHQELLAGSFNN